MIGIHGPLVGAAGVVSMRAFGSCERGWVDVSTYRGRPPGRDELEEIQTFNMNDTGSDRALAYADSHILVDEDSVLARVAFIPSSSQYSGDRLGVVLLGSDYSASLSLVGLTPDELILTMTADDHGYTDLKTAIRHHPG